MTYSGSPAFLILSAIHDTWARFKLHVHLPREEFFPLGKERVVELQGIRGLYASLRMEAFLTQDQTLCRFQTAAREYQVGDDDGHGPGVSLGAMDENPVAVGYVAVDPAHAFPYGLNRKRLLVGEPVVPVDHMGGRFVGLLFKQIEYGRRPVAGRDRGEPTEG